MAPNLQIKTQPTLLRVSLPLWLQRVTEHVFTFYVRDVIDEVSDHRLPHCLILQRNPALWWLASKKYDEGSSRLPPQLKTK